jgi:hypothetical protein
MPMRKSLVLVLGVGVVAVAATLLAQTLPPVYFNHITIFLSQETYAAVLQSPFLRDEFSAFQERTVQRDGGAWSYTGIFISGQHTYLEFFKAGQFPHLGTTIPGQIVFNMWIDDRTLLPLFRDRLATEGSPTHIDTGRNAQNQPMYDVVKSEGGPASDFGPGMRVDTEIKGYYPDGITRGKRLEKVYLPERYLHDVTGFTLTANEDERKRLIQEFRAYGYNIKADGANQVVSGPEVTFTLVPAKPNTPRTLTIDLSMNRATTSEQTFKFDDGGELRVRGSAGRWVFTFPTE